MTKNNENRIECLQCGHIFQYDTTNVFRHFWVTTDRHYRYEHVSDCIVCPVCNQRIDIKEEKDCYALPIKIPPHGLETENNECKRWLYNMSIYITGDLHGEIDIKKLSFKNWSESRDLTREDVLIITGDFGLPFWPTETLPINNDMKQYEKDSNKIYHYWIQWLSERPYTILFADGNHECFPYWNKQPESILFGGRVQQHPDAANVYHLCRGEYYTIQNRTFWVMGGANSFDKEWRTEGVNWWKEEIPSITEMEHGLNTLAAHGNKVDYIVTHTMPQKLIGPVLGVGYESEPTQSYLDTVYDRAQFKEWFCGHFHRDLTDIDYNIHVLYNTITKVGDY